MGGVRPLRYSGGGGSIDHHNFGGSGGRKW